ncbi:hypothetical protein POSPLADRAFT_1041822 [Postia placenta MAD-698-R-SB12]|uniref:Uncharacterized protein n=1 Tax=Postia placenta MAD-698-R-SB12 TaxID=670580 RepID=A0A1X6MLE2_9APHY|nr:hypothetical protein POSPLADRAFT_1041822 [Postia placenta MAD-698-R-SB12]OSX57002.1 hypothetical protein POSPLADRAFT_1041822 [Postia placenta MAD-698-R-SB12]
MCRYDTAQRWLWLDLNSFTLDACPLAHVQNTMTHLGCIRPRLGSWELLRHIASFNPNLKGDGHGVADVRLC